MPIKIVSTLFLLVLLIACGGNPDESIRDGTPASVTSGDVDATPTPNSTPGISLAPPADVEASLDTAANLESRGELEAALEVYVAIALSNRAESAPAALAAARLLLELERPADAIVLLAEAVPEPLGHEAAHYLRARAYSQLSLWQEALDQYDFYIQSQRPGLPYAYLDRALVLLELDRPLEAAASAETGLNLDPSAGARPRFLLVAAQSYERAGDFDAAILWFERLADSSASGGDSAFALSRIADLKRFQEDPSASEVLLRLLAGYPSTAVAFSELTAALARDESVPAVVQGLIFYRHGLYTEAEPQFLAQIESEPDGPASAEAHYYLAAIQELRGETDLALANYAAVPRLNAASSVADDALWWSARLLEIEGDLEGAEALLTRLIREFPASSWAEEAAFRGGLLFYLDGRFLEAAAFWQKSLLSVQASSSRQRLSFWQGKALLDSGDRAAAATVLGALAAANEDDYYGIRARALVMGEGGQPRSTFEANIDLEPEFDWQAAESWLSLETGRAVVASAWPDEDRWLRAEELWLVGRETQAVGEVFSLIESYAHDPIAMYTLAQDLRAQGRPTLSARAGQRLMRVLDTNPNEGLPRPLLSLSYPPAFTQEVIQHAEANTVSALLLLAFVRQESFFDARARSPAGALGLTQVLPATGERIAANLGLTGYDPGQLLQADLNLHFGAYYMSQQLTDFDEELYAAFAAYNAGPAAAARWRALEGSADADIYLELVEFTETRLYIQFVAENYAIYRYLYGGEEVPTLPD